MTTKDFAMAKQSTFGSSVFRGPAPSTFNDGVFAARSTAGGGGERVRLAGILGQRRRVPELVPPGSGGERFARLTMGGWLSAFLPIEGHEGEPLYPRHYVLLQLAQDRRLVPERPGRPPVTKGPSPARRPTKDSRPLPAAFQRKFQLFVRQF
jgi:hypothetical protein